MIHRHSRLKCYIIILYYFSICLYSTGNSTQPIWFDNVHCSTPNLKCLANCIKCPSSEVHNCVHSKDITLECSKLN